ncbi:Phosphoglycerate kinase, partial [Mycoplasmopsis synoviae]
MKKTLNDLNLKNKTVLVRVDFNVPMKNGVVTSNKRIVAALPTIKKVLSENAKVVLMSHLGRVKSEEDKAKYNLELVAKELSKLLGKEVTFVNATRGKELEDAIAKLPHGEVLLMQNTRYEDLNDKAESKNSPELGKYW